STSARVFLLTDPRVRMRNENQNQPEEQVSECLDSAFNRSDEVRCRIFPRLQCAFARLSPDSRLTNKRTRLAARYSQLVEKSAQEQVRSWQRRPCSSKTRIRTMERSLEA